MAVRKRTWKTASGEQKQAWIVDYVDQAGKRHIKTFQKKKDADAALAETKVEVSRGTHTPENQSVTIDRAGDLWIETCEANKLERTTVEAYTQHLGLHIRPFLGRVKLAQLSTPMIREFEDKLRAGKPAPGEQEGRQRSADMVKRVLRSFGTMLADSQERGLVARNVVRDLRSSRGRGKERRADRRQKGRLKVGVDIPTREEIKAIVGASEGRWRPILLMAVFTGLRSSELRGLRWQDVDLKKSEIHVRQRADNRGIMGAPKSETSERAVPIPPLVLNTLREWKLACPNGAHGLVFPSGTGNPENHSNIVKRGLQPVQIAAGVTKSQKDPETGKTIKVAKYSGLHSLRHFYASWCINRTADGGLGLPPKVVQERLGHSTIVLTMDRYGHLFPRGDDTAEMALAEQALLA